MFYLPSSITINGMNTEIVRTVAYIATLRENIVYTHL